MVATQKFTQLTAAGNTSSIKVAENRHHTVVYKVASINTNVVVNAQGSLNGTDFFNLEASNITKTANGTYYLTYKNLLINFFRFSFVSESGGTAVTVDVEYRGSST